MRRPNVRSSWLHFELARIKQSENKMNKNILCLTSLVFIVTACALDGPEPEDVCGDLDVSKCDSVTLPVDCEGKDTGQHFVNVNVQPTPIIVAPPNRCIDTKDFGREVTFNITPASVAEGTVWICPKDSADTWLEGTNSPDNHEIVIEVPESDYPDDGERHDYTVVTTEGKCLDPRLDVY